MYDDEDDDDDDDSYDYRDSNPSSPRRLGHGEDDDIDADMEDEDDDDNVDDNAIIGDVDDDEDEDEVVRKRHDVAHLSERGLGPKTTTMTSASEAPDGTNPCVLCRHKGCDAGQTDCQYCSRAAEVTTQTPPPTPPQRDDDLFSCFYILVEAAMSQIEQCKKQGLQNNGERIVTS